MTCSICKKVEASNGFKTCDSCRERARTSAKRHYHRNKTQCLARQKQYRGANKEAHQARCSRWHKATIKERKKNAQWLEKDKANKRRWYLKNKESMSVKGRERYQKNTERLRGQNKRWKLHNKEKVQP